MNHHDHEELSQWDAAYVLGALTPTDRQAYEDHLERCGVCRDAVGDLAPMPGLLARIAPETDTGRPDPPAPTDLVERMLAQDRQRRVRRRRRMLGWAVASAAALVLAIVIPAALMNRAAEPDLVSVALSAVEPTPAAFDVEVDLEATEWGTRLLIACDYPPATGYQRPEPWYGLVVTDVDGATSQVSTWQAVSGQTVTLEAATATDLEDLVSVSVVTPTGKTLLTAPVPSSGSGTR